MDDLNERLQRLEDMAAIQQLFIDYGAHLDAHDFEAYANLFAEDAEVLLGPMGRAKGRDNIKTMMEGTVGGSGGSSFHLIGNPIVDLNGDTATSRVTWTVIQRDSSGRPQLGMLGHHRDQLVRRDGRWYFLRRAGYVDIPSAMPKAAS